MINTIIHDLFEKIGHTWNIGSKTNVPSEDDVELVLDSAFTKLYDGATGDRLSVAGLIIEKAESGYDVYAYVGSYQ